MLEGMIFLQSSSLFQNGVLGDLFTKWAEAGLFSYLLPFLLIFALVFGILTRTNLFKDNKVVNGIIALAVALMALQFDFVPSFFSQIFPRVGIALAIILGIMIVVGLFAPKDSPAVNYVLLGIGVITIGLVIIQSAGAVGWQSGQWWEEHWQLVVGAIFLFILVAVIIGSASKREGKAKSIEFKGPWAQD
jgi:peptidoglycan/LPS O-acetylase OafA/YrhL